MADFNHLKTLSRIVLASTDSGTFFHLIFFVLLLGKLSFVFAWASV